MKILTAATLLLGCVSVAQSNSAHQPRGLQWSWRESQEIPASHSIAKIKGLTSTERSKLLSAFAADLKDSPDAAQAAAEVRVKLVDLNGDGVPEVIAQAGDSYNCSPTGNCEFWIFQKAANRYRLILKKGAVQTFTIQPTRTKDYVDLLLAMHGSATDKGLFVYRFSGGHYRRVACYDADWTYVGKDGEFHHLKNPRITPCQE